MKSAMSLMLLLCPLTASIERLSSSQMDELNEEKTKVVRIRREAKFADRLACFGTAMCNNNIVISMGSTSKS